MLLEFWLTAARNIADLLLWMFLVFRTSENSPVTLYKLGPLKQKNPALIIVSSEIQTHQDSSSFGNPLPQLTVMIHEKN